jgi:hypothetical protein
MTETQRVKKVINWLVFMEYAENERELAEKLGYEITKKVSSSCILSDE